MIESSLSWSSKWHFSIIIERSLEISWIALNRVDNSCNGTLWKKKYTLWIFNRTIESVKPWRTSVASLKWLDKKTTRNNDNYCWVTTFATFFFIRTPFVVENDDWRPCTRITNARRAKKNGETSHFIYLNWIFVVDLSLFMCFLVRIHFANICGRIISLGGQ